MRNKIFAAAALLALATTSGALAQQSQPEDSQAETAPAHQAASADWPSLGAQPEQAGDLYQAQTRNNGSFAGATQDSTLPGSLNSGTELLGADRQSDLKE